MQESQPTDKPTAAFVLSLLAGLWMLATAVMISGYGWSAPAQRQGWGIVVLKVSQNLHTFPIKSPTPSARLSNSRLS